jgi:tetratricopeptide (TPR) repeat protein
MAIEPNSVRRRILVWWSAVFLLVIFLGACGTMEEKRDKFFAEGKELYQKADYVRARLQFKNALQIDPKFPEAALWLGKTELKLGNPRGAYGALSQAVELKPELTEAQILLGQLLLLGKQPDKAEEKSKLALEREPHNPEALMLAAALARVRQQPEKALELLAEVRRLKPDLAAAYLATAAIQAGQKQPEAAAATLEAGIKANPRSLELQVARAMLADSHRHFDVGESYLLKAVELEPKNTKLRAALVRHYILAGQKEKAEQALRQNLVLEPDQETNVVALAQFLNQEGRSREAEQTFKDFIAKHKENFPARLALANFYLSTGQRGRGAKVLEEITTLDPSGPKGMEAKNQLAQLRLAQGQVEEAEKLVAGILKDNPKDMAATQTQGLIALAKKDGLKAVSSFRIITQDQPQNPEAWLLLARAHLVNNEVEQAKDKAKKALELKPDYQEARRFLYGIYLNAKDYQGAIQTIQGYLRLNEKDMFNLIALGETYAQAGDTAKARATFQKAAELDPKSPQGPFNLALLSLKMKKPEEAIKYLNQALAADPNFFPALQALVAVYREQNKPDQALEAVKKALSRSPKNPLLHQMLGEVLLVQKQPKAAAAALEEAINLNPRQVSALRLLTLAYLQESEPAQAVLQLEQKVSDPKTPPVFSLVLGSIYEKQHKFDQAIGLYNTLLERNLFTTLARNNLAYLLAEHQPTPENLARALKLSTETLEDSPEEPSFLDTQGWILCKQGNFAKGESFLEKAVGHSPEQPALLYHMGWCEAKLGKVQAAREALQKALASKSEFADRQEAEKLLKSLPAGK